MRASTRIRQRLVAPGAEAAARVAAVVATVVMALAACGDDGGTAQGGAPGGDGGSGGSGGADGGSGQEFECSITAEQVGEVLGAPVDQSEGACAFSPDGAAGATPSAAFLGQLPELCEGDFLEQSGYTERIEGLGVDAFLKPDQGGTAEIWVCGPAPFTVVVGAGPDLGREGAVSAAETLALIALEG